MKKCFGKKEIGHCVRKDQDKNFDFNFSKAATKIENRKPETGNRKPETGNRNEITTRISKLMKVGISLGSVAAIFKAPMRLVTQSVVGQRERELAVGLVLGFRRFFA